MAKRAHGAYNKYVSYFDRIKRIEDLLLVTWTSGSPTMSIGTVPTFYVNTSTDRVGIRTALPAYSAHFIVSDGLIVSSNNTDTTTKNFFVGSRHYTNAEEPFYWANGSCTNGTNVLNLGGGSSSGNPATSVSVYTGTFNTITGTLRATFDNSGNILTGTAVDASNKTLSIGTRNYTVANNNTYFISGTITGATAGTMLLGGGISTSVPVNSITMYTGTHASSGGTSAITITSGQELDINTTAGIKFYNTYSGGTGLSFGTALTYYEEASGTLNLSGAYVSGTTLGYNITRIGRLITITFNEVSFTTTSSTFMAASSLPSFWRPSQKVAAATNIFYSANLNLTRGYIDTDGFIYFGNSVTSNFWGSGTACIIYRHSISYIL